MEILLRLKLSNVLLLSAHADGNEKRHISTWRKCIFEKKATISDEAAEFFQSNNGATKVVAIIVARIS